ncbi:hypothetical protein RCH33_1539 [Flavobacterium daejeonense]|nr:hypothetical protein RCH33_1539 [Flavobacterium daejeonense]
MLYNYYLRILIIVWLLLKNDTKKTFKKNDYLLFLPKKRIL